MGYVALFPRYPRSKVIKVKRVRYVVSEFWSVSIMNEDKVKFDMGTLLGMLYDPRVLRWSY